MKTEIKRRQFLQGTSSLLGLLALGRAHGYLRRELGPRLQLQYMPDLKFFWDEGFDRAARVDAVLAEIRRDEEGEQ